jgi:hypothetical protein
VEEPPRYGELSMRNSRAHLKYDISDSASQHGEMVSSGGEVLKCLKEDI